MRLLLLLPLCLIGGCYFRPYPPAYSGSYPLSPAPAYDTRYYAPYDQQYYQQYDRPAYAGSESEWGQPIHLDQLPGQGQAPNENNPPSYPPSQNETQYSGGMQPGYDNHPAAHCDTPENPLACN